MFSEYMIICIFYISGIIISKTFDMSGALFMSLLVFFAAIVRSIVERRVKWLFLLLSFVVLFGSFQYFEKTQNKLYYEFSEKYVTVSGTIYSQPTSSESEYKNRYVLKLDSVSYLDKTVETNQKILLNTKETFPFGTKITASGFLSEVDGIKNENEYDFSLYYKGKGIFARVVAFDIESHGTAFSLAPDFLIGRGRYLATSVIDEHFSGNSSAFLKAFITNDKSGFSDDYLSLLIKTGIYRILYTPFIHISLIFFVAGLLPLGKKQRNYLVVTLVFLYALANASSPTIIKAAMICGFFLLRKEIFGFANKLDIISKILLIMLIFDPLLCFNSGFLMSVASSVIIYLSYKPLYMRLLRFFTAKKLKGRRFLSKIISLWIIFFFGTLPISAYLFNSISVYAVIFTVLATPVVFFILLASPFMLISLGIFGTSPIIAPIMGKALDFIAFLPEFVKELPVYYIELKTPKITDIFAFYLLWWVFIRAVASKLKTKQTAVILAVTLGICLSSLPLYEFNTLSVYFVNVGQGDGAVLHTSRGETVLIDGGGAAEYETNYNIGERIYLPYLISHGFSDIDVAVVTHFHKDHVEGIIAAAETLKIDTIVMPDAYPENPYWVKLSKIAREKGITIEYLSCGDEITFKSGLNIKFIAPSQLESNEPNDTSLVAHVTYGEFSALFTGDSTDEIDNTYPKDIDLLKVAHHGSDSQSSKEYLEHTNPRYAVISVGENNSYNLPSDNVVNRLNESGAKILRTDRMGDIQFKIKKDGTIRYKTLKGD